MERKIKSKQTGDPYIFFLSFCSKILIIFIGKKRKMSLEVPTQEKATERKCGIVSYVALEAAFCTPLSDISCMSYSRVH